MNLLEAFQNKAVEGIGKMPKKMIETWQSKIFFFGDDVYKVYKWEKNQFVDLSSPVDRQKFYFNDFNWNQYMSPSVYSALQGVRRKNDFWINCESNQADDFYIKMIRIDETQGLNEKLREGILGFECIEKLVKVQSDKLMELTEQKGSDLDDVFNLGWKELFERRIEDANVFANSASDYIDFNKTERYINVFKDIVSKHPYFDSFPTNRLQVAIDNHSDNIIISEKEKEQIFKKEAGELLIGILIYPELLVISGFRGPINMLKRYTEYIEISWVSFRKKSLYFMNYIMLC